MAEEKRSFLDWLVFKGPADTEGELRTHLSELDGRTLSDKLRRLYTWILNNAVLTPVYDVAYGERSGQTLVFPNADALSLPDGEAYSSYILLPLLGLAARRKCLLVGGPGRGKTAIASLLAQAAGIERGELRRAVQHGHPQLTVADLLGTPLPADLLRAEELSQIKVAWQRWLGLPVKIIDEYNRIPTKTQSALLSLMSEGYAEQFGQVVEAGPSAWFLTANDDAGGGTYAVIEALRDRIDVCVRALTFNPWQLERLLERLEKDRDPAAAMPAEVRFTPEELSRLEAEIRTVAVPRPVLRRIEHFLGSLDFCQRASPLFEHKSKDALRLAGLRLGQVCNEDCPLDKARHVCSQVETGVSVRAYLTLLAFSKAMAYFRGRPAVELEDVRQLAPFVLHEKLTPNRQSAYFSRERERLLSDKVAWIRAMFDLSMAQHEALHPAGSSPLEPLLEELAPGLHGLPPSEVQRRLKAIAGLIRQYHKGGELSAPVYNDLLMLKALELRYRAYLRWLEAAGKDAG